MKLFRYFKANSGKVATTAYSRRAPASVALAIGIGAIVGLASVMAMATQSASPSTVAPAARPAAGAKKAASAMGWFAAADVYVDGGEKAVGSYQVELVMPEGAKLVGIEGGSAKGFADAPYYDKAALQNNRVILGAIAMSTARAGENPGARTVELKPDAGRQRVARVHVFFEPEVKNPWGQMRAKMMAAGDAAADRMEPPPGVTVVPFDPAAKPGTP
ncbi:MAG: hypothetical protein IBJ18_03075 [Phycisphaerales bacterium]|nr:hypothetical protein [Phycisphaerales bacterium]